VSLITKYEDEFDRESFEELKRARFALMVDAEIALCNGTSKDEWSVNGRRSVLTRLL
jgi:hypothetical protein